MGFCVAHQPSLPRWLRASGRWNERRWHRQRVRARALCRMKLLMGMERPAGTARWDSRLTVRWRSFRVLPRCLHTAGRGQERDKGYEQMARLSWQGSVLTAEAWARENAHTRTLLRILSGIHHLGFVRNNMGTSLMLLFLRLRASLTLQLLLTVLLRSMQSPLRQLPT